MQNYLIYIILILSRLELEYHSYQKCILPVKLKNRSALISDRSYLDNYFNINL